MKNSKALIFTIITTPIYCYFSFLILNNLNLSFTINILIFFFNYYIFLKIENLVNRRISLNTEKLNFEFYFVWILLSILTILLIYFSSFSFLILVFLFGILFYINWKINRTIIFYIFFLIFAGFIYFLLTFLIFGGIIWIII